MHGVGLRVGHQVRKEEAYVLGLLLAQWDGQLRHDAALGRAALRRGRQRFVVVTCHYFFSSGDEGRGLTRKWTLSASSISASFSRRSVQ